MCPWRACTGSLRSSSAGSWERTTARSSRGTWTPTWTSSCSASTGDFELARDAVLSALATGRRHRTVDLRQRRRALARANEAGVALLDGHPVLLFDWS